MQIRTYRPADRDAIVALWQTVFGYGQPRNRPAKVLADKLAHSGDLLLVAVRDGRLLGTAMAGYDGHRGWMYRVAVVETERRSGVGRALVHAAEAALATRGCAKINLQTHADNAAAVAFWQRLGYVAEARVSLGKDLGSAPTEG